MLESSPPETPTPSTPNNLPRFAANLAPRGRYGYQSYRFWKRLIDILASTVSLIIFGPLMLLIALLVASKDGFPVIFKQRRIGEGGEIFHMYKFRSMVKNAEEVLRKDPVLWAEFQKNFKLDPDQRITKVGGFIRKTSLDELPSLERSQGRYERSWTATNRRERAIDVWRSPGVISSNEARVCRTMAVLGPIGNFVRGAH